MLKIKPYVGQVVQFMPNPSDDVAKSNSNTGYIAAIITRVWSDTMVNLKIIPDHGAMQDRGSVSHISNNPAGYHFIFINPASQNIDLDVEQLVSFGDYLLSEVREKSVSEINRRVVNHADIENWKVLHGIIN